MNRNKTIARNTLMLYFRMLLTMGVGLYTVRVVLKSIGEIDYGIYSVVGGIVGLLGVMNGALISATQRFLSYELGRNNTPQYENVFSMMLIIFLLLSSGIFIISLIAGNWAITSLLIIPPERVEVARWLLYFSVITFAVNTAGIPYMSSVIAHEKMDIYAYMSIIEVTLKLIAVYLLEISTFDKLATYGFLTMSVTVLVTLGYRFYCIKKLEGCRFRFCWDMKLFHKLSSYIGWSLFGSLTSILNVEGQAILLNLFFGPTINAAKAIADRINMAVSSFSGNLYTAVRPQIIKSHAIGNNEQMFDLACISSKFSYYLLLILALPLAFSMEGVLNIWLGQDMVSQKMVDFCVLMLIFSLVNVFEQPITVMIQATGNVRRYQIIIGTCTLLFLPLSFFLFKLGLPPESSLWALIGIYTAVQFLRLLIAKSQVSFPLRRYFAKVALPVMLSTLPTVVISYHLISFFNHSFEDTILIIACCGVAAFFFICTLGLSQEERQFIMSYFNKIIKTKNKI